MSDSTFPLNFQFKHTGLYRYREKYWKEAMTRNKNQTNLLLSIFSQNGAFGAVIVTQTTNTLWNINKELPFPWSVTRRDMKIWSRAQKFLTNRGYRHWLVGRIGYNFDDKCNGTYCSVFEKIKEMLLFGTISYKNVLLAIFREFSEQNFENW